MPPCQRAKPIASSAGVIGVIPAWASHIAARAHDQTDRKAIQLCHTGRKCASAVWEIVTFDPEMEDVGPQGS